MKSLVSKVDDQFVLLATGDELCLTFDASTLPPLRKGFTRTFLLDSHGYCKSMDPLAASPRAVEPLPFRGMSSYPPAENETPPDRAAYAQKWNKRE